MRGFDVVDRVVNTFEGVFGGLDSRQLNQKNNLHIRYSSADGEVMLRLEMLSGITVMGQAKKCRELEDRLRVHGVVERFAAAPSPRFDGAPRHASPSDIPAQIEALAQLVEKGFLSADEFELKKTALLARL